MITLVFSAMVLASVPVMPFVNDPQLESLKVGAAQAQDAREIRLLGDEILKVEENSLALDSSLAAGREAANPDQMISDNKMILDNRTEASNGMRLYRFIIPSGGGLNLKLKSESSRIVMAFLKSVKSKPMAAGIQRANMPPSSIRRSRIGLRNQTGTTQEAVLMLQGPVGVKFSMEIERSWENK